jgi:LuxR family maltose regulon positive regulatory protein
VAAPPWDRHPAVTTPPRLPEGITARLRLEKLLESGIAGPLTLVCAGAGWGKTTLVASWLADRGPDAEPVAWVSLERDHNDLAVFWRTVLAAIRATGAVPPHNAIATVEPGLAMGADTARQIHAGLAGLDRPIVVVLDDFHLVDSPAVLDAVAALLRQPGSLRLVMVTRRDPTLPLHRLRVEGGLTEVRGADLAFTSDEAQTLLARHGVHATPDDLDRVLRRTEGWPAGLRLAAMFLSRTDEPGAVDRFTGDQRAVADYLVSEVLDAQPPDLRRFLLHTSVLREVGPDVADALLGDTHGARQLERLERSNAFVSAIGTAPVRYRYHQLLREMLTHQLRLEDAEDYRLLHRRAAQWYREHGVPLEALRHAAAASDWQLFAEIFVTGAAPMLVSSDRTALAELLRLFPQHELDRSPEAMLCGAALHFLDGRFRDVGTAVAAARRSLPAGPGSPAHVLGLLLALVADRAEGDLETIVAHSEQAVRLAGELDPPTSRLAQALGAIASSLAAIGAFWAGDGDAAADDLMAADARTAAFGVEIQHLALRGYLALVAVERGRLQDAEAIAAAVLRTAAARGWTGLVQIGPSYLASALVHLDRAEAMPADRMLHQGLAVEQVTADLLVATALRVGQARVLVLRGQPHDALRLLDRLPVPIRLGPRISELVRVARTEALLAAGDAQAAAAVIAAPGRARPPGQVGQLGPDAVVCQARCAMALGDAASAEHLLARLRAPAVPAGAATAAWVLTALAADRRREDGLASSALATALERAEPEGITRPFLLLDRPRSRALLERHVRAQGAHRSFATAVLQAIAPETTVAPAPALAEPLTDREITVLQLLPTMLGNAEIADELFVSVNTVKAHLKGLYRKLGVTSRREAVERGRALGLLL